MNAAAAVLEDCIESNGKIIFDGRVYFPPILKRILDWFQSLEETKQEAFKDVSVPSLIFLGLVSMKPRVKRPKELKRERGIALRAKREAKRVAQVCS